MSMVFKKCYLVKVLKEVNAIERSHFIDDHERNQLIQMVVKEFNGLERSYLPGS